MYVSRNVEEHSRDHCCGKAIITTYSEHLFVALVMQHAKRMRRVVLSSVACLSLSYFSTLSDKLHDFREKSYWTKTPEEEGSSFRNVVVCVLDDGKIPLDVLQAAPISRNSVVQLIMFFDDRYMWTITRF